MWWENPSVTQGAIAERVGLSRKAVNEAFQTKGWQDAKRDIIAERMPGLIPAAWQALMHSFAKGNPSGAVEVLRAFGCLTNPREGQLAMTTLLDIIKAEAGL